TSAKSAGYGGEPAMLATLNREQMVSLTCFPPSQTNLPKRRLHLLRKSGLHRCQRKLVKETTRSLENAVNRWPAKPAFAQEIEILVLRHGLPFLPRVRTVAFLRRTCFVKCNRYPECMPLLTSDRDGAQTLDLTPQSHGRYRLSHGDYRLDDRNSGSKYLWFLADKYIRCRSRKIKSRGIHIH
ncbi:hypothetical protein SK128_021291, partial [Halocaridina rubra]